MKKLLSSLLMLFLISLVLTTCSNIASASGSMYSDKMHKKLDPETSTGKMIVGYYVETDTYTKDYVPLFYQTGDPGKVGAILNITKDPVSSTYSGGFQVKSNRIIVELIDFQTGEVISVRSFSPYFPARYRVGSSVAVDEGDVKSWVRSTWEAYLLETGK